MLFFTGRARGLAKGRGEHIYRIFTVYFLEVFSKPFGPEKRLYVTMLAFRMKLKMIQ